MQKVLNKKIDYLTQPQLIIHGIFKNTEDQSMHSACIICKNLTLLLQVQLNSQTNVWPYSYIDNWWNGIKF